MHFQSDSTPFTQFKSKYLCQCARGETIKTSHRVALGSAHHLPVVEPLGGEHLVESAQGELPLLKDAGQSAGREAAQAPLEPQLVLLLRPELPPPKGAYHRVPTAPPLLGMTWWTGNTTPLVWRLAPAQLEGRKGEKQGEMQRFGMWCGHKHVITAVPS